MTASALRDELNVGGESDHRFIWSSTARLILEDDKLPRDLDASADAIG